MTMGGDGTVGEVYKVYNESKQKGVYSHIPTGTTNDMARNYDIISKKPEMVIRDILSGEIVELDSYKVNDITAAYTSTFGYVSHVPYITKPWLKKNFGHAGYVISAIPYLIKKPERYNITYETDNLSGSDNFILGAVSNSVGFVGIKIFKNADLKDGKIELLLLKDISPELIRKIFLDYLKDDIDLSKYEDYVVTDSSSSIKLTFNDSYPSFPIDIDGENSYECPSKDKPSVDFKIGNKIRVLKRKK